MAGPKPKQAKTASKNNPSTRIAAKKRYYMGKEVKPIKFIGSLAQNGDYMAMEYVENNQVVLGTNNLPLPWELAIDSANT